MSVKIETELKPFPVPDFVYEQVDPRPKQEGFKELPKHALKDLSVETLDKLCDEFRQEVFRKANKQDPCNLNQVP